MVVVPNKRTALGISNVMKRSLVSTESVFCKTMTSPISDSTAAVINLSVFIFDSHR